MYHMCTVVPRAWYGGIVKYTVLAIVPQSADIFITKRRRGRVVAARFYESMQQKLLAWGLSPHRGIPVPDKTDE
jgi:hypothetical protein